MGTTQKAQWLAKPEVPKVNRKPEVQADRQALCRWMKEPADIPEGERNAQHECPTEKGTPPGSIGGQEATPACCAESAREAATTITVFLRKDARPGPLADQSLRIFRRPTSAS